MPLTDNYGQNISFPTLADKPNAQTMGDGIVNGLTPRSVMRFASASVRGATLTAPVEGMVTWLQDVNLLQVYDGSAWVTVAAGTSIWTNLSLASGYTNNGNNNGTGQYRVVNLFGEPSIMLRGGLNLTYSGGNISNGGVINSTALPSSARPSTLRTVTVACSAASSTVTSLKLDIQTDGYLKIIGTGGTDLPPWVSLNGVICSL